MKKPSLKAVSLIMSVVILISQSYSLSARTILTAVPSMNESAFALDQNALDLALTGLNELDNYLTTNEGKTYSDLQAAGGELILNISDNTASLGLPQEASLDHPLVIPSFYWGCILGQLGLLLVFVLTDKDKEQTKHALYGCLANNLFIFFIYYALTEQNR